MSKTEILNVCQHYCCDHEIYRITQIDVASFHVERYSRGEGFVDDGNLAEIRFHGHEISKAEAEQMMVARIISA